MTPLSPIFSNFASALRLTAGTRRATTRQAEPAQLLELYQFENCPWCRLVRERLTELDLDYIVRNCPKGDSPKRADLKVRGGKVQVPYLVDPNTGRSLYESRDIVAYLDATYG